MIEDKLLIWKFKSGNKDALARIYEKYKNNLLRMATGLLNKSSIAEDIVHDVFITLAKSPERLNDKHYSPHINLISCREIFSDSFFLE